MKKRLSSIIFDLDGTLLDTLEDIADSGNRALAAMGFPGHPVEAYRYLVGDGVEMLIQRAVPADCHGAQTLGRCAQIYREEYARNWNGKTRIYPGIGEMLDEVVSAGQTLAVLSNKPHDFTEQCVRSYLGKWTFGAVLGQRQSVPRKPDPAAALEIAQQFNKPAEEFLYVGDTATDMQTAKAAGMFAVGVLWGFRERAELEEAGAEAIIAHPSELARLLA